jgi:hypothetical protein
VAFDEPCAADDPRNVAASAALDAITTRVEALAKDGDPKPIVADLNKAVEMPCLERASLPMYLDELDSGWALRDWWGRDGEWWLRHYLALTTRDESGVHVVFPTDPRNTLTQQSRPDHPLHHLLCDHDDEACQAEPAGWRLRATRLFDLDAERRVHKQRPPVDDESCLERAKAKAAEDQYQAWYECSTKGQKRQRMFPLGGMRAPTDGWLVVQGRRGHYGFCDEVRAYDLKTGAFYATQSCGGLALRRNGSVDQKATDDARKPKQLVGRMDVLALRETAWMIFMADELSRDGVQAAFGTYVPEGIRVGWRADEGLGGFGMGGFSMSSAQTTLAWRYQRKGKMLHSGTLRWPNDYNHIGKEHAVRLLQIAEADLRFGCAPAALPNLAMSGAKPAVSGLDASPSSLDQAHRALLDALAQLRRGAKRCR